MSFLPQTIPVRTRLLIAMFVALAACGPRRDMDVVTGDATVADIPSNTCNAPMLACSGECVNPQTDPDHCGACGNACPAGRGCVAGSCTMQCPSPQTACSGVCSDVMTDRANCGSCGVACAAGLVCSMGRCSLECAGGFATCTGGVDGGTSDAGTGRYCADTQIDRHNCGACNHACSAGEVCLAGTCTPGCPTGQMLCSGQCIDVTTNPAHCGACGAACPGGQTCVGGTCSMSCPTGQMYCTDRCLDVVNDRTNCGTCGMTCGDGEVCVGGSCTVMCPMDRVNCSMRCVDTNTDRTNCGTCGTNCAAGEVCVAGMCRATCASGTASCGGACVDLTNDRSNCGACGTTCATGQFCVGGRCGASCLPGQTVCGGICVNTDVDTANCGYCGGACGPGYGCLAGYCRPLEGTDAAGCMPPSRQCGPVCTDTRNDNNNCGACGTACSSDRTCVTGMCVAPCAAGQARCGATCTTVAYDRNNCGACGNVCAPGLSCSLGVCVTEATFRVTALEATGCNVIDVNSPAGDDRGGIAASFTTVFYEGDSALVRAGGGDLAGLVSVGVHHDSLFGDMRDGTIYVLMDAMGGEVRYDFSTVMTTVTQLGVLDPNTGLLTATRIPLSQPIPIAYDFSSTTQPGIFGGYGRVYIHSGAATPAAWYQIRLPDGDVTMLAARAVPPHTGSESFAFWGIGEYYAGEAYAVFVQDSSTIVRYRISDGTSSTLATFTDLGDTASIAFSPARNRWYFHHEGWSQFSTTTSEALGYCPGTWDTP